MSTKTVDFTTEEKVRLMERVRTLISNTKDGIVSWNGTAVSWTKEHGLSVYHGGKFMVRGLLGDAAEVVKQLGVWFTELWANIKGVLGKKSTAKEGVVIEASKGLKANIKANEPKPAVDVVDVVIVPVRKSHIEQGGVVLQEATAHAATDEFLAEGNNKAMSERMVWAVAASDASDGVKYTKAEFMKAVNGLELGFNKEQVLSVWKVARIVNLGEHKSDIKQAELAAAGLVTDGELVVLLNNNKANNQVMNERIYALLK